MRGLGAEREGVLQTGAEHFEALYLFLQGLPGLAGVMNPGQPLQAPGPHADDSCRTCAATICKQRCCIILGFLKTFQLPRGRGKVMEEKIRLG